MLHILLGLLKIIGIILAVILGLILLVIFVVLFAAFRYNVTASANGDVKSIKANVKFSWLFRLISGFVIYEDGNVDWQVKVAWKKFNVPKEEVASTVEEKVEDIAKETAKEIVSDVVEEVKSIPTEVIQEVKEDTVKITESVKSEEEAPKKKPRKEKEKKIRYSIQKISDKIKEINEMKEKILSFIKAEVHKKAFQRVLKELLRLLKKLKPKKLKANVEFGFEDPYKTGSILAYLSMLYPFYGDNINVTPNFSETVLKGDIYLKGHIRISYMANMGIRMIIDRNVRLTIKEFMKLIAKNKK